MHKRRAFINLSEQSAAGVAALTAPRKLRHVCSAEASEDLCLEACERAWVSTTAAEAEGNMWEQRKSKPRPLDMRVLVAAETIPKICCFGSSSYYLAVLKDKKLNGSY